MTIALILLGVISSHVVANEWQIDIAVTEAKKLLNDDNDGWRTQNISDAKLNQERYTGVFINAKRSNWPVTLVINIFGAGDKLISQGAEEIASITEAHLGFRKHFLSKNNAWSTYAGAGFSFLTTRVSHNLEGVKFSQKDTGAGYWFGGGINFHFSDRWYTGLDIRYSTGTLKVFEQTRKVDGVMAGLTVGLIF